MLPDTAPASDLAARLAEPFPPDEVKWKPAAVSGQRCLAIAYVSARSIMDRLDQVLGPAGWSDEYAVLSDGSVMCKLSLKLGDEWITKADVGSQSEQPDEGDRMKAAFSDALKRAAVKFGIGRYLYRLPSTWVAYDPQKKQMAVTPKLPDWALPDRAARPSTKPAKEPAISATQLQAEEIAEQVVGRISEEQERQLVELLKTSGADIKRFLAHFHVPSVGSLAAQDFDRASAMLRAKQKTAGAAKR